MIPLLTFLIAAYCGLGSVFFVGGGWYALAVLGLFRQPMPDEIMAVAILGSLIGSAAFLLLLAVTVLRGH